MNVLPEIKTRPKIEAGQRWVTVGEGIARVLATDGRMFGYPVIAELEDGLLYCLTDLGYVPMEGPHASKLDFVDLAPQTIKREVALYRSEGGQIHALDRDDAIDGQDMRRISEPMTIEFTLLPGEHP